MRPHRSRSGAVFITLAALTVVAAVVGCAAPSEEPARGAADSASEAEAVRSSEVIDLSRFDLVDLTYAYDEDTLFWPTATEIFELRSQAYGMTEGGYFYSANTFSAPEHGGTHLDAPIHFHADGQTVDQVPLERLFARAVVIGVSAQAADDPDYRLSAADVAAWEAEHGAVPAGSVVLLRTGWSARWPDALAYLGDDTPGDASNLHFPSYGEEAARLLVEERGVGMLGVDTASIDHGASTDFMVHRVAAARNVPGLENLADLSALPATGAWVIALPIKIKGGSGGPLRIVAFLPN